MSAIDDKCNAQTVVNQYPGDRYSITVFCNEPKGHDGEHVGYAGGLQPTDTDAMRNMRRVWWPVSQ